MKKFFIIDIRPSRINFALFLFRLVVAGFMLTHGWSKLNDLLAGGDIKFGDPLGIGVVMSLGLAVFAEFICSVLVGIGLMTRLALIPLIVTMSVAGFMVHSADPFGRKELALLYLAIYFVLLITGPGKVSLDYLIFGEKRQRW